MHHLRLICFLLLYKTVQCQFVDGDLRLNGIGSSASQGRVEVYKNGTWGTVCSRQFEREEAQVVCRQIGLSIQNSQAIQGGRFGAGTGPILIDEIKCHGYERRLINCMFTYWSSNSCDHSDDVGVVCQPPPPTTTSRQTVPSQIGTAPMYRQTVDTLTYHVSTYDGVIRLGGIGSSLSQGRIEIYKNGTWGTVCSQHFAREEAQVVCRQIGVPEMYLASSQAILDGRFGTGSGTILIDDIKCIGNEPRLINCTCSSTWTNQNCNHGHDIGVICYAPPSNTTRQPVPPQVWTMPRYTTRPPAQSCTYDYGLCNNQNPTVRLVRPALFVNGAGVVQVYVNGQWGGISDDCFNRVSAQVICRMLCYDASKAVPGSDEFDTSCIREPAVLTNVSCNGLESDIASCVYSTSHSNTVALAKVTCVDMTTVIPTIEPPDLNCDDGLITANFSSAWAGFVPHSQLSLVWSHAGVCNARTEDHGDYIIVSIPFDECGTQFTSNTSHLIYENAVLYVPAPTGLITRIRTYMIYLVCLLPRDYQVDGQLETATDSLQQTATSNCSVLMNFYTDNFITVVTTYPVQITVGNWLQVGIQLQDCDIDNLKLVVSSCYATPSSNKNDPIRYPLFTDKCKDDETVTFFCLSDLEFGFRYQTFKFVQYNEVHIHCEAYVCPKSDRSQECDCLCHRNTLGQIGKRKKRDTKRNWIHVKSNVILMYDPADDQGKFGNIGPTRPSFVNNFTTQFPKTTPAMTQNHYSDNVIPELKVVKKQDTSSKKVKQVPQFDNENHIRDSTEPHGNSEFHGEKLDNMESAEDRDSGDRNNVDDKVEAIKPKTESGHPAEVSGSGVLNTDESAGMIQPNAEHGHLADYAVTPLSNKNDEVPNNVDDKVEGGKPKTGSGHTAEDSNGVSGSGVSNAEETVETIKPRAEHGHVVAPVSGKDHVQQYMTSRSEQTKLGTTVSVDFPGGELPNRKDSFAGMQSTILKTEGSHDSQDTTTRRIGDIQANTETANTPEVENGAKVSFERLVLGRNEASGSSISICGFFFWLSLLSLSLFLF